MTHTSLLDRIDRCISTAINDGYSELGTEKRDRHWQRVETMEDAKEAISDMLAVLKRALELPHQSEMEEPGGLWHDMRAAIARATGPSPQRADDKL